MCTPLLNLLKAASSTVTTPKGLCKFQRCQDSPEQPPSRQRGEESLARDTSLSFLCIPSQVTGSCRGCSSNLLALQEPSSTGTDLAHAGSGDICRQERAQIHPLPSPSSALMAAFTGPVQAKPLGFYRQQSKPDSDRSTLQCTHLV